jgi:hypothetical protein
MTRRSRLQWWRIIRDLIVSIVVAVIVVSAVDLLISIFGSPF